MRQYLHDGWRDPGDDTYRVAAIIRMLSQCFALGSIALFGLVVLFHPSSFRNTWMEEYSTGSTRWIVGLVAALLGTGGFAGIGYQLWREAKTWQLRKMRADGFVAGGIVVGIALILIGMQMLNPMRGGSTFGFTVAAIGILVIAGFFLVGIVFAFLPKLARNKKLSGATVIRRYGLDERYMEHDDHPSPVEDGMSAMLELRLANGDKLELRCQPGVYDRVRVGKRGTAIVKNNRVEGFVGDE